MSDTSTIALNYAGAGERPHVVPLGMTILLSIALAGLPSLLLRGRAAIRPLLLIYAVAAACAGVVFIVWQVLLDGEDWTGLWLFLGLYALLVSATLRLSLKDRRDSAVRGRSPVAPKAVWLTLFWISFVAAACGWVAAVGAMALMVVLSATGIDPLSIVILVLIGVAFLLAAVLLVATVVETLRSPWPASRHAEMRVG